MGHDITGYRKADSKELSYIRIGAWNRYKAFLLYDSLSSPNQNCGVSGCGGSIDYSPLQIAQAIAKFKYLCGESKEDIVESMKSSEGYQTSKSSIDNLMTVLTGRPLVEPDVPEEAQRYQEDVLRFLKDLDIGEEVTIDFS